MSLRLPGLHLVALLICIFWGALANAQPVDVGLRAGISRSMFLGGEAHFLFARENFDRNESIRTQGGFEVSVFLRKTVGARLALQPELSFAMRGTEQTFTRFSGGRNVVDYLFGYAQAALLIRYAARTDAPPRIGISLGPYVGTLATRKAKVWMKPSGVRTSNSLSEVEAIRNVDFGITIGADVALWSRVGADVRFAFGLRDFIDADRLSEPARSQQPGLYNAALVLGLYFLL